MSTDSDHMPTLTRRDFQPKGDVKWCPGCGDYAILAQIQRVFPELGIPRENFAVISGIGCSGRFPYYMNTYGFHTIHGRALGLATGLKVSRPDLSVWIATGDGDSLSIGGNHLIHCLRRNVDLKILLFNNEIYGLTKGQYSPTSEVGKLTKSTPMGSLDAPFNPLRLALGAGATFVARTIDRDPKHMAQIFRRAAAHKGTALVEILQNCVIFNDGAHSHLTDKLEKDHTQLKVEHGEPLLFDGGEHGVIFDDFRAKVVDVAEVGLENIHVHDEKAPIAYHQLLAGREVGNPTALGVLRAVDEPTYDESVNQQVAQAQRTRGVGTLAALLQGGDTWTVDH
jgi:2-oxoglutarate ferredoxin oxidoreductase subunit beta